MVFETMNRKELAFRMGISYDTLLRYMKKYLSKEFLKQIRGRVLFKSEAKFIYEEIKKSKRNELGSN